MRTTATIIGTLLLGAIVPATTPLAAAETAESSATAVPTDLVWQWDAPHRFYVETQVILPQAIWFFAEFNKEQRVAAFQVRTVLDCGAGTVERRRVREVTCAIEDIGLVAAGLPAKAGLLQPILEELDERLSGAQVQLQVRDDGRIANVDLEGLDRRNQRVGRMNENLRIIVSRAVAGLDLQLPRPGNAGDELWAQYQNLLMQAPTAVGTSGASEIVHKVIEARADGTMMIESAGRGVIVPGESANNYAATMAAFGTFDVGAGVLLERTWTTIGLPTASSPIAEGFSGIRYSQLGRLKLLGADEEVAVGETIEVSPPGIALTTLTMWPAFGTTPTPSM